MFEEACRYLTQHRSVHIEELTHWLTIPSVSSDPQCADEMVRCAEYTARLLTEAGMEQVEILPTRGHPLVTGQWLHAPGAPTVLIYGHYDVQPADPLELWETSPFEPHINDDTIVARGATDDKGQVFMHIKAIQAMLKTSGSLPVNVKFLIEGEEEIASENLPTFLKEYGKRFEADIMVVSDTAMWDRDTPSITFGLRGLAYMEVECTGPDRDLHSGGFGGAVANPAEILARIIASIKDENGHIRIPGYYDQVREITDRERELLARIPYDEEKYKAGVGVKALWGEHDRTVLERVWSRPTVEVNGIWGGYTGPGAKTVLPAKAFAKISMRLVPDQDPVAITDMVADYFASQAPSSVTIKVNKLAGGKPFHTSVENPFMEVAAEALQETFGREPLFIRNGGSIPIVAELRDLLGLDTLLIGFALPGSRAHSPNENFHLPTAWKGTEAIIRMYAKFAEIP